MKQASKRAETLPVESIPCLLPTWSTETVDFMDQDRSVSKSCETLKLLSPAENFVR